MRPAKPQRSTSPTRIAKKVALLAALATFPATVISSPGNILSAQTPIDQGGSPRSVGNFGHGEGPGSDVVVLNSRAFSIPFSVDQVGQQPVEVQLFALSGDDSRWKLLERKPPTIKEFKFVGLADGPVWFTTRTIDSSGRIQPAGPLSPHLKVLVDTTQPTIALQYDADADGSIQASLAINDATPIKKIRIEYATDVKPRWQAIDAATLDSQGQFAFRPAEDWKQLSIQVIAADTAGNQSVETAMIDRPRIANSMTRRLASGPTAGSAEALSAGYRTPNIPQHTTATPEYYSVAQNINGPQYSVPLRPANDFTLSGPSDQSPKNFAAAIPAPPTQPETLPVDAAAQWPNTQPFNAPSTHADEDVTANASDVIRPITEKSLVDTRWQDDKSPGNVAALNEQRFEPQRIDTEQNASQHRSMRAEEFASSGALPGSQEPANQSVTQGPVRYSDSEKFSLEYELEAVGSSGVETVELWGTIDGGETWKRWGSDPDNVSPFDIETAQEGTFGFRIVVLGKNGLASPRPLPGESPDISILVDKTRPQVEIIGARYGEGDRTGSLVIQYQCNDENLASRPISLSFSDSLDGPWTTIAGGLRNEGDYIWPADPNLPRQIFLRVDATDKAGNVGSHVAERPIASQGLAPRARIRSFRSVNGGFDSARDSTDIALPQTATRNDQRNYPRAKFQ